jgi:predicted nucleic acid-binding protein
LGTGRYSTAADSHQGRQAWTSSAAGIELLAGDEGWRQAFDEWAPATFPTDVANGQLRGLRVPAAEVVARLERMSAVGIETVDRGLNGLLEAVGLADRHGLTVYDALYLQLALDVEADLATLEGDLRRAAELEGLTVTDLAGADPP